MVRIQFLRVLGACTLLQAFTSLVSDVDGLATPRKEESPSIFHPRGEFTSHHSLLNEATEESIDEAREVVRIAIDTMTKLNKARLDNPIHDTHRLHSGANLTRRNDRGYPPLLQITEEVAHAAALVAEADTASKLATGSATLATRAEGTFWMKDIRRQGTVPWGDDAQYKVSIKEKLPVFQLCHSDFLLPRPYQS